MISSTTLTGQDRQEVFNLDERLVARNERSEWERLVREVNKDRCSNCGNTDRVRISMVVPLEAGGKYVVSNGRLLCRTCEIAAEAILKAKPGDTPVRPLNFWISRSLYDKLHAKVRNGSGFGSMGALIRYLMSKYVTDELRFDDLEQYQDSGADVKVNVWVEAERYVLFKRLLDKRGLTVTDAVKGMILMYFETVSGLSVQGQ